MKYTLFIILSAFLLGSCTRNDDEADMQELAPVISVQLPEHFKADQSYEIEIKYQYPTSCHTYSGLDISQKENEITVGVVTSYPVNKPNCLKTGNLHSTAKINFVVERDDFYIFKFWKGYSATGLDQFLIEEVSVVPSEEEN